VLAQRGVPKEALPEEASPKRRAQKRLTKRVACQPSASEWRVSPLHASGVSALCNAVANLQPVEGAGEVIAPPADPAAAAAAAEQPRRERERQFENHALAPAPPAQQQQGGDAVIRDANGNAV
jgi:hypothetical protein